MRLKIILLAVFALLCASPVFSQNSPVPVGGWDVTFTLENNLSRRLTFMSFSNGTGTFRLIGPRPTPQVSSIVPAVWSRPVPGLMSFSGEVQLPVGNCCRETGTLMFKGTQSSPGGTITGRAIFVSDLSPTTTPAGNGVQFGTFVATPLPIIALKKR